MKCRCSRSKRQSVEGECGVGERWQYKMKEEQEVKALEECNDKERV